MPILNDAHERASTCEKRILAMPVTEAIVRYAAAAIAGYLLGSFPSGVIVGRLFGNVDPRSRGSGKTGATNVLRTLGPGPAALVVVFDVGKGVVAVLLARYVFMPVAAGATANMQGWAEAAAGFAALCGHNFSIFIHFTGGRGVATGGGTMLAISPVAFGCALVGLIVPIAVTRYVSLGSMLAGVVGTAVDWVLVATGRDIVPHAVYFAAGTLFIIYSHRDNIQRLLNGTERKLGQPAT
jgi:glycerol-3-phosphate acyltransferase PlsY